MHIIADRRVKIVATIGPATQSRENLKKLIESGMNIARLNFSHGTHEDHLSVIKNIRELSKELAAPVGILQDLQGPKIRVGKMKDGMMELKEGEKVIVSTATTLGENGVIPTEYEPLPRECRPGMKILLDDGLLELRVDKVHEDEIHCTVIYGGKLTDRKGMNVPGANLSIECLTPKDLKDLEFGLANKVDYVALSFVRKGDDIRKLRGLIDAKFPSARIIAKIEMLEAIDNLDEIVRLCDGGVMVARGDLAVEVGAAQLPGLQKEIIRLCNELGRPVITATQMLESMKTNPTPTRAEVTDVANAVLDGSDALMLSAESASGKYPFKCVQTMDEIIREVERTGKYYYNMQTGGDFLTVAEAIAASACLSAKKLDATVIVCLTTSGKTATMITRYRPKARVIAATHILSTLNRLELVWGMQTLVIDPYDSTDVAMNQIEELLLKYGLVKTGDKVVLTMGMPVVDKATTNALRVYQVKREGIERLTEAQLPLRCRPRP